MRTIKTLGSAGSLGLLVAGSLVFGSAQSASATTCGTVAANSFPGTVSTATSFETNGFCDFKPSVGGDGTATMSTSQRNSGTRSAKLHVTDTSGSIANLSTPAFPSGTKTVYADGWFNITTAGVSGNNVPYLRFFSGTTRIADTYRYNSNGQMWLRVTSPSGFVYTKLTSGSVSMGAWHRVAMRVTTNGSKSTVQVWLDGALKYSSSAVNINATSLSKVQLGAEHNRQKGDEFIDDVTIKR
ncbi:hypothetical protein QFZ65_000606 [Arthrobacter sp. B3I9]|uniref:hypothetical protein n=1 Tax=Arthrobacter sp. B3I9 TaxID=3042270 RepID=UPI00278D4939|nr:hypothetical protein [Arthrobacter sp. B3I9]MDQ0848668.1 hypothetical protein [Arthrobacter sp. B3I9]